MRLSKDQDGQPNGLKNSGPKKKFHASITHHKGGASTHHVSSHSSKEEAQAFYAAKFPQAHNITCKEC